MRRRARPSRSFSLSLKMAHHQKCYYLGHGKHVTRSNLSEANTNRDYRIFEEYAYYLVSEVRRKWATDIFKLDGNVYAFDSTTISLYLDVSWWAKFRKQKGGIKIHALCGRMYGMVFESSVKVKSDYSVV